jgi:hypothetical protein
MHIARSDQENHVYYRSTQIDNFRPMSLLSSAASRLYTFRPFPICIAGISPYLGTHVWDLRITMPKSTELLTLSRRCRGVRRLYFISTSFFLLSKHDHVALVLCPTTQDCLVARPANMRIERERFVT